MKRHPSLDIPSEVWAHRIDPQVREQLVLVYWPLLTRIVGSLRQNLPDHVEEGDLRSYGISGLYKAIERYDPDRGHSFEKFASNYIRGAVLDELRSLDWAPRSLRKRQRQLKEAEKTLYARGQKFTDSDTAELLRWTVHDVQTTRRQADISWPRSLDEIRGDADEWDLYAVVPDANGSAEQIALSSEQSPEDDRSSILNAQMVSYIECQDAQTRAVFVLSYFLDLKYPEVAEHLGITEARVQRIHAGILRDFYDHLRSLLVDLDD